MVFNRILNASKSKLAFALDLRFQIVDGDKIDAMMGEMATEPSAKGFTDE